MKIGITPGMGIGPELLPKAIQKAQFPSHAELIIFKGSAQEALLESIEWARAKKIDALVTGPIQKSILQDIHGCSFQGQTELLHKYLAADSKPPLMCFAGATFIMGLATVHIPVSQVSESLNQDILTQKLERLINGSVKTQQKPAKDIRIAVLSLNPHAGEGGLLGTEEEQIIKPVVHQFKHLGYQVEGPFGADGFFGFGAYKSYDAVLAMMHDQGLPPYKLLCQGKAANITFGLKIPRTSPAHGTADNLVGTGQANPDSFALAIELAVQLSSRTPDQVRGRL